MSATRKYHWDLWLSRRRFRLRRGEDFACSASSMVQQIRNAASLRGIGVSIEEKDNGIDVRVDRAFQSDAAAVRVERG